LCSEQITKDKQERPPEILKKKKKKANHNSVGDYSNESNILTNS